jgi:hypothetical protein
MIVVRLFITAKMQRSQSISVEVSIIYSAYRFSPALYTPSNAPPNVPFGGSQYIHLPAILWLTVNEIQNSWRLL